MPLPLFNWSLKKLLLTETGTFNVARIKILYTVLIFSLTKVVIVIPITWYHHQYFQLSRALVILVFYTVLLKLLLTNKSYIRGITHLMLGLGILLIWSNIFVYAQAINVITMQFIFMLIVSSFYLLNRFYGIIYSLLSALPVVIFLLLFNKEPLHLNISPNELAPPGSMIIIILNFLTIITSHFLYHQAFSSNIDEKEYLNTQLLKAVEEAKRSERSKSDFLSTMSHELRTPLNSVIGITGLLLDEPHNNEQKENLKILSFSAASLHAVINDILDFNKLDSDKLHLENISVDLVELINNICSGMQFQAKEKGLQLVLNIDEELKHTIVITDPTRISQIIFNLVGNSIKFTHKGIVTVSLKLTSRSSDHIDIGFSIADTGIGINAEKHKIVFEPFIQASANITRNFGGTGLGLPIVRRLLMLFNSDINLESSPGNGSNFFFDIKFKLDNRPAATSMLGIDIEYDLSGLRVLVAEDNAINILLIKKLCSKWNIQPTIAENGIEAVEKLLCGTFDVILMDIHMPMMDGYEATKEIRNIKDTAKANIPIIALTASVSNNLESKIKDAGMNDYVQKPFNSKELYNKLKNIAIGSVVS